MVTNASGSYVQHLARGLEGVVAAATRIAEVDGDRGRLTLRGYDIAELAGRTQFEEVAYLLWHGKLPSGDEYRELKADMSGARALPGPVQDTLRAVAGHGDMMHGLRAAAAALSIGDSDVDNIGIPQSQKRAARLQAMMPVVVANLWRLSKGQDILAPRPEHGLAEGLLYMLEGTDPHPARVEGLNAYLTAVSEHGLNASTFTGRVVISTDSDMVSALTAAIAALKGPKHGGVPGPVLKMLDAIGTAEQAEGYIRRELDAGKRIMGFGHRLYRVRDPRAAILEAAALKMADLTGDTHLLDLTHVVEQTTVRVLAEVKPGRDLYANVELYAALILHAVGVPSELFTSCFAIGRTAGWTAHMVEQLEDNRLIRPNSLYVGPRGLRWRPMDERACTLS